MGNFEFIISGHRYIGQNLGILSGSAWFGIVHRNEYVDLKKIHIVWLVQKVPEEANFMRYFGNFLKNPDFCQISGRNPDQFGQKSPDLDKSPEIRT